MYGYILGYRDEGVNTIITIQICEYFHLYRFFYSHVFDIIKKCLQKSRILYF